MDITKIHLQEGREITDLRIGVILRTMKTL